MTEDIINMHDMELVFSITDAMGIHRERVIVPLVKEDRGAVKRLPTGEVEIVLPRCVELETWLSVLHAELRELGFEHVEKE